MFFVASDLSEVRRERLTSSFSLREVTVTACTLDAVKIIFAELFCPSNSSMENPALRVSGHGGSTNRIFIVENGAEAANGQWTIDEVTGE